MPRPVTPQEMNALFNTVANRHPDLQEARNACHFCNEPTPGWTISWDYYSAHTILCRRFWDTVFWAARQRGFRYKTEFRPVRSRNDNWEQQAFFVFTTR